MVEPVIRLIFYNPVSVTVEEFDAILKELVARQIANDTQLGDRILVTLLRNLTWRREEIVRQRAWEQQPHSENE